MHKNRSVNCSSHISFSIQHQVEAEACLSVYKWIKIRFSLAGLWSGLKKIAMILFFICCENGIEKVKRWPCFTLIVANVAFAQHLEYLEAFVNICFRHSSAAGILEMQFIWASSPFKHTPPCSFILSEKLFPTRLRWGLVVSSSWHFV